jgi:hypothetical protein
MSKTEKEFNPYEHLREMLHEFNATHLNTFHPENVAGVSLRDAGRVEVWQIGNHVFMVQVYHKQHGVQLYFHDEDDDGTWDVTRDLLRQLASRPDNRVTFAVGPKKVKPKDVTAS